MRILFTGGSGKAGKHVVPYLLAQGHRVVNADLVPLDYAGVDNLIVDITDSGQIFNAANEGHSVDLTTNQIIERYYHGVPQTTDMGTDETFFSIKKAKEMLEFAPEHDWRKYIDG